MPLHICAVLISNMSSKTHKHKCKENDNHFVVNLETDTGKDLDGQIEVGDALEKGLTVIGLEDLKAGLNMVGLDIVVAESDNTPIKGNHDYDNDNRSK